MPSAAALCLLSSSASPSPAPSTAPDLSSALPPLQVDDELEIKAYYAGHVLGAAMFQIRVGSESVVYTVRGACGPRKGCLGGERGRLPDASFSARGIIT